MGFVFQTCWTRIASAEITRPDVKCCLSELFDDQQKSSLNNTDDAIALNDADQAISAQPWEFA
jgi:hypothetical protein